MGQGIGCRIVEKSGSKQKIGFMKEFKKIPLFKSSFEENAFWQLHDSTNYIDWRKAKQASFPNLELSIKTILVCVPDQEEN